MHDELTSIYHQRQLYTFLKTLTEGDGAALTVLVAIRKHMKMNDRGICQLLDASQEHVETLMKHLRDVEVVRVESQNGERVYLLNPLMGEAYFFLFDVLMRLAVHPREILYLLGKQHEEHLRLQQLERQVIDLKQQLKDRSR